MRIASQVSADFSAWWFVLGALDFHEARFAVGLTHEKAETYTRSEWQGDGRVIAMSMQTVPRASGRR